jgi:predicted ATPase
LLVFKENFDVITFEMYANIYLNEENELMFSKKNASFNGTYLKLGDEKLLLNQESSNDKMTFIINLDNKIVHIEINKELEINSLYNHALEYNILDIFDDHNFGYLSTDRVPPAYTFPFSEMQIKNNSIGLEGEYTAHYLSENKHKKLTIEALKHPESTTLQLLENTYKWMGDISSGVTISASADPSTQSVKLSYQYEYGNNTSGNYSPLNVGFGLTYVLPVIVLILKSKPGDLLIIENPESHLHPKGQSKIAELCAIAAHNGVQIIVESHSDHFLNGLRVATKNKIIAPNESQTYFFRKEIDSLDTVVDAINIDNDGNLNNYPKDFFDEWDNNLDKLLGL